MKPFAAPLALAPFLALAACGPPTPAGLHVAPASPSASLSSGTAVERYFPLVDGRVYHYATSNDRGDPGVLVAHVRRTEAASGELRFPASARRFRYEADGVVTFSKIGAAAYVLKEPLAQGTTWVGEHGGTTTISAVGARLDTPAGHFDACVVTTERTSGPAPVRYETTLCPGTGIVVLEVQSGQSLERATLQGYGEPVSIGAEGLQRLP